MPKRPATPENSVENMIADFRRNRLHAPKTLETYKYLIRKQIADLREGGRHTMPWEIDEADVKWLLQQMEGRGLTISTRRGYMSALRVWTEYYGNSTIRDMRIRWPADMRPNVDWITQDQAVALLAMPKTPSQELVVHCELCLGMRRIEVLRLRPDSFRGRYVEILGKGSMGGKPRLMPYHRNTEAVLARYMEYRNALINLARAQRPAVTVPESLMIWSRGNRLHSYSAKGTGIDEMLKPLGDELGVHFGNHTLRRTFGRTMYRSGVEVATISRMMGHESMDQTLKYIGVNLDDMGEAMNAFAL